METNLIYPENVIPNLRYQFCPICAERLIRKELFDLAKMVQAFLLDWLNMENPPKRQQSERCTRKPV